MSRGWMRAVARGLIAVLVLAQMAIAAYACPALSAAKATDAQTSSAVATLAASGDAMPMANGGPCADMNGPMDPSSPNLCSEHCKLGQQSDHAATLNVPVAVLTVLYATPPQPEPALAPHPAAATMSALVAATPPHAILHCVYRI